MRENTSRTLTCGFIHCKPKKRQFFFLYVKNSAFLTWHYRCSTVSGLDDHVNPRGGGWLSAPTSVSREADKIPVLLFFLLPLGVTASLCSHSFTKLESEYPRVSGRFYRPWPNTLTLACGFLWACAPVVNWKMLFLKAVCENTFFQRSLNSTAFCEVLLWNHKEGSDLPVWRPKNVIILMKQSLWHSGLLWCDRVEKIKQRQNSSSCLQSTFIALIKTGLTLAVGRQTE